MHPMVAGECVVGKLEYVKAQRRCVRSNVSIPFLVGNVKASAGHILYSLCEIENRLAEGIMVIPSFIWLLLTWMC